MIRKNQSIINMLNGLSDGVLLVISYLLSSWLWLELVRADRDNMAALSVHAVLISILYAIPVVIALAVFRIYNPSRVRRFRAELPLVWSADLLGILTGMSVLFLIRAQDFSRGVILLFFLTGGCALSVKRWLFHRLLSTLRAKGYNQKHVLVAGTGRLARQYAEAVAGDPGLGYHIVGFMGDETEELSWLGGFDAVDGYLSMNDIDEVIVALDPDELDSTRPLINACEHNGTKVSVIPFYNDLIPSSAVIEPVNGIRLINLRANPLDNMGLALIKRAFDLVVSLLLLVILSPLLLGIALGVKLSSPGPVLFRQERVGRGKRLFRMYKFRSMRINSAEDTGWTTDADPRKTRFGAFLRKFSLDELPQLLNVVRGEMSLIGPRPEIPFYVEQFKESVPRYMVKHQVRPGMTGWAQVNGWRGDTSIEKRIEFDVWYIEHWSIRLDLRILLRTALGGWINREQVRQSKAGED